MGEEFDFHKECAFSTALTSKVFFEEHFERPFCGLHKELFRLLDDPTVLRGVVAAPRGFGKTTTVMVGFLGRVVLYGLYDVVVLLSATKDHSQEQLKTLADETSVSDKVVGEFGSVEGELWNLDRKSFSTGVTIFARGAGQQIRGTKVGKNRPALIIVDDIETRELVANKDRLEAFKKWFYTDVMRAGTDTGKTCKIVFIGTVLSEDSLLSDLLKDSRWTSVRLEAFDDDLKPSYPEFMSEKDVQDLVAEYTEKGMLDELYQEYRNLPMSRQTAVFRRFHIYVDEDLMHQQLWVDLLKRKIPAFVICDPAREVNRNNCFSAAVGCALDLRVGTFYVERTLQERLLPEELIERCFDMADELRTPIVYVEENGLNQWMTTVVKTIMFKRGRMYDVRPLKAVGDKMDRIRLLGPLVNSGMIHFNKGHCGGLIGMLQSFPKGAFVDLPDALAHINTVLRDTNGWSYLEMDGELLEKSRQLGGEVVEEEEVFDLASLLYA